MSDPNVEPVEFGMINGFGFFLIAIGVLTALISLIPYLFKTSTTLSYVILAGTISVILGIGLVFIETVYKRVMG